MGAGCRTGPGQVDDCSEGRSRSSFQKQRGPVSPEKPRLQVGGSRSWPPQVEEKKVRRKSESQSTGPLFLPFLSSWRSAAHGRLSSTAKKRTVRSKYSAKFERNG